MSIPKNPETLVIKNQFYPQGLREIDVWNYYQKIKPTFFREVLGKNLTIYFAVELNKIVVMRRAKTPTGFLRIHWSNYDEVISGRTISIHSNFGKTSDFGIIDIDIADFDLSRRATLNVYNYLIRKCNFIDSALIKYTGKESFHIICNLKRTMYIDNIRILIRKFLQESELSKIYTVESKRFPKIPNLDLSSNKYLGGYITLNSLSTIGLRSIVVPDNKILRFRKEDAKI